jgi:tRNA (guanine-N7-)-methyltransferase
MQKFLKSFGRTKGHKLRDREKVLLENFLPQIRPSSLGNLKRLWLEIGFGSGHHIIQLIEERRDQDITIIGCEPYINGAVKVLKYLEKQKSPNVFLKDADARPLLEVLPDQSIEKLYLLFPDPWPKKKHHKRRIVEEAFIHLVNQKLMTAGEFILATDHQNYSEWIEEKLPEAAKTLLTCEKACQEAGILTNYCKKALKKDLPIHFFKLIKR